MQAVLRFTDAVFALCQSAAMGSFPSAVRSVVYSTGAVHAVLGEHLQSPLEYDIMTSQVTPDSQIDKCLTRHTPSNGIDFSPGRFISVKPIQGFQWVTFAIPSDSGVKVSVSTEWESYTNEDGLAISTAQSINLLLYAESLPLMAFFLKYTKEMPVMGRCARTRAIASQGLDHISMSDYPRSVSTYQFEFGLDETYHTAVVSGNMIEKERLIRTSSVQLSFGVRIKVSSKVVAFAVATVDRALMVNVAGVDVRVGESGDRWIVLPTKCWNGTSGYITFEILSYTKKGINAIVYTREYHFPIIVHD